MQLPDDLEWKRDKMRRVAADAARYRQSVAIPQQAEQDVFGGLGGSQPRFDPSQFSDLKTSREQAGGQQEVPQQAQQNISGIINQEQRNSVPGVAWTQDLGNRQRDETGDIEAGVSEYLHGIGDIADAATATVLYGGRQLGKGIVRASGGVLPEQSASDTAGLASDVSAPFNRILSRASGDFSNAPNERKGLTSQTMGEVGEAGSLTLDPNASAGERLVGGVGAAAGVGALALSGGIPARVNPGKLASGALDNLNVERILAGKRAIPNPTVGDLFSGVSKPSGNSIGFNRRGGIFIKNPALDIDTAEKYIKRSVWVIQKKFVNLLETGKADKYPDDVVEAIKGATREDIADALRSPSNNPDVHKAIRKVFKSTGAEIAEDIKAFGQDANNPYRAVSDQDILRQLAGESVPETAYQGNELTPSDKFDLSVMSGKRKLPKIGGEAPEIAGAKPSEAEIEQQLTQKYGKPPAELDNPDYGKASVSDLWQSINHETTPEQIESAVQSMEGMTKDQLVNTAESIGLRFSGSKGTAKMKEAIRDRLVTQRGDAIRSGPLAESVPSYVSNKPEASIEARLSETPKAAPPEATPVEVPPATQDIPANVSSQGQGETQANAQANAQGRQGLLNEAAPGSFSGDTGVQPAVSGSTGFIGPSKYFNKPRIVNQSPPPDVRPTHGPSPDTRPKFGPEYVPEQGPAPFGPPQGPGPWGPDHAPSPYGPTQNVVRPKNIPTPWTPNPHFKDKYGSKLAGSPLNTDNQIERLEVIGAKAQRELDKNPGALDAKSQEDIDAIHETVERAKRAITNTNKWYSEIGEGVDKAQRELLGNRIKRSPEVLDLKDYITSPTDPSVRYTKTTALVDDHVGQALPGVKPLNDKQAQMIDTYKKGINFTSQKAAENGVVTTGPQGQKYWEAQDGISRLFRDIPPDTRHMLETDAGFRKRILTKILKQPGNEGIPMSQAEAEFIRPANSPESTMAAEHLRSVKVWPDQVYDDITKKWWDTNDFVHKAIPTKGYFRSGLGNVLKDQLARAALVGEFGTRDVGGGFKDLLEGPGGLLEKSGQVSKDAQREVQSLIASLSGKRNEAGYVSLNVPNEVRTRNLTQLVGAATRHVVDTVTNMVWAKDFMRPVYQAAMDAPGGPLAKTLSAGITAADQARNLTGSALNKVGLGFLGKRIAQPYQAKLASHGFPIEDYVNGTLSAVGRFQGEINSLNKIQNTAQYLGDFNPFKLVGGWINDAVFGASESTTLNSAMRNANSYVKKAINGDLNVGHYTKLSNDGISGKSIEWLKSIKGNKNVPDYDIREFAHEMAGNTINRFNKQAGSAAFNAKAMNTPLITDNARFLNYDYTMLRATEDAIKTTQSIWNSSASPAEKAQAMAGKILNYGVKLGVLTASGEAVRSITNHLLSRPETDWEKTPWTVSRMVADIFSTKMFGMAAIIGDGLLHKAGVKRPWADVNGKEGRSWEPSDVQFMAKGADTAMNLGGAVVGKAAQAAGTPMTKQPNVATALQKLGGGGLSKVAVGDQSKTAPKRGRSPADALKLLGGQSGQVAPPVTPQPSKRGRTPADALKLLR